VSLDTGVDPVLIAKIFFLSLGARQKKAVVLDADGGAFSEDLRKHSAETRM
jgi:hypothetical protein